MKLGVVKHVEDMSDGIGGVCDHLLSCVADVSVCGVFDVGMSGVGFCLFGDGVRRCSGGGVVYSNYICVWCC